MIQTECQIVLRSVSSVLAPAVLAAAIVYFLDVHGELDALQDGDSGQPEHIHGTDDMKKPLRADKPSLDGRFYHISFAPFPWGDYGHMLGHGMTAHLPREKGMLQLERTGPFIPPISIPFDIIVTDAFRKSIEQAGLTGLTFRTVVKKLIVEFHWEHWDRSKDLPELPAGGCPEHYVLGHPHSQKAADQMGVVWEARMKRLCRAGAINERADLSYDVCLYEPLDAVRDIDFFRAKQFGWYFVSRRAKQWLEAKAPQWVSFRPVFTGREGDMIQRARIVIDLRELREPLAADVRKSLAAFSSQHPNTPISTVALWGDGVHGTASLHVDTPHHSAAYVKEWQKKGTDWYGKDGQGPYCNNCWGMAHCIGEYRFPGYPDLSPAGIDAPVDYITLDGSRQRPEENEGELGRHRMVFPLLKSVLAEFEPFRQLCRVAPFRVGVQMRDSPWMEFRLVAIDGTSTRYSV
jgi:hypothetical protein